jgi:hypothetical protein
MVKEMTEEEQFKTEAQVAIKVLQICDEVISE